MHVSVLDGIMPLIKEMLPGSVSDAEVLSWLQHGDDAFSVKLETALERVKALKSRLADAELAMQSVTRTSDGSTHGPARLSSKSTPSGSDDDSGRQATHPRSNSRVCAPQSGSQAAGLLRPGSNSDTSRASSSSDDTSEADSAGIMEEERLRRRVAEQDQLLDALLGSITSRSATHTCSQQRHCGCDASRNDGFMTASMLPGDCTVQMLS